MFHPLKLSNDNDNDNDNGYNDIDNDNDNDDIGSTCKNSTSYTYSSSDRMQGTTRTNRHLTTKKIAILALGQLASLLLSSAGALNATLHLECHFSAPTFQCGLIYFLLSLNLLWCRALRKRHSQLRQQCHQHQQQQEEEEKEEERPTRLLFYYPLIALLDVEANYVTFLAYKFTTLTSISLLDVLAVPSAMVFSKLLLQRRYRIVHVLGAAICVCGAFVNVASDYRDRGDDTHEDDDDGGDDDGQEEEYPHKVLGDALAIVGGTLFGLNDVLTETLIKLTANDTATSTDTNDHHWQKIKQGLAVAEYLGMIGVFGSIISFLQVLILERDNVVQFLSASPTLSSANATINDGGGYDAITSTSATCTKAYGLSILFAGAFVSYLSYMVMSFFLLVSEAALMNLSLLTSDFWAVLFAMAVERIFPRSLFYVALALIVGGVFLYEMAPSPMMVVTASIDEDTVMECNDGENRNSSLEAYSRHHQGNSTSHDLTSISNGKDHALGLTEQRTGEII